MKTHILEQDLTCANFVEQALQVEGLYQDMKDLVLKQKPSQWRNEQLCSIHDFLSGLIDVMFSDWLGRFLALFNIKLCTYKGFHLG